MTLSRSEMMFPGGEVREACARAGGPLDQVTWDQYASGVGYQDTCAGI